MSKHNFDFQTFFDKTVSNTTPVTLTRPVENLDGCALHLIADGSLDGAWKIEVSNNYDNFTGGGTGDFTDITALFTFTGNGGAGNKTVSHSTAALQSQLATSPARLDLKAIKVTFTPTTGTGRVACIFGGKGNE